MIPVATLTGLVDLEAPDHRRITPAAIAHGLAKINRWAGATELPVTDAQHSALVMEIFCRARPGLAPYGILALLHDAHEYLLGDLLAPSVRLLDTRLPGLAAIIAAEKARLDTHIRVALGVLPEMTQAELAVAGSAIAEADYAAYDVEWRSFIPACNGPSPWLEHGRAMGVAARREKALAWPDAEARFLKLLEHQLHYRPWEMAA